MDIYIIYEIYILEWQTNMIMDLPGRQTLSSRRDLSSK